MGKDSHFTGQPVYSQVLKLLDKEKILQISHNIKGSEAYVKHFDGYQHLVVMLFGVLKHFDLVILFLLQYQQFSDVLLRYCVLQILSILNFLNGIFLYFSRS